MHVDLSRHLTPKDCHILRRTEGGSHHVVIIRVGSARPSNEFVIKIPVTGTEERWCDEHAYTMRCEALLMNYLRKYTSIPVPEVIAFQDRIDNPLGAPYILMRKAFGKSAYCLWLDAEGEDGQNADNPSEQMIRKRITFLKSLALYMAELQKLTFEKLGMLNFDNNVDKPVVAHYWETRGGIQIRQEPVASAREFFLSGLNARLPANTTPRNLSECQNNNGGIQDTRKGINKLQGVRRIMEIIYDSSCFDGKAPVSSEGNSFILRHPDLDLQNILVDDDNTITSILDWHGTITAPRCIGYVALPRFLTHDWFPHFTLSDPPYMSWTVDYYRRVYADSMKEHCDDGKYTYKSAMYQAAAAAPSCQWCSDACSDVVNKVLLQLPALRLTDLNEFQERLGRGWKAAEEYLKVEIGILFESE
ncbi:hypothetical protein CC86DRAFT_471378 [Ophiobolus disseminans]|uniref:Aminoglycoside phosphotransferase domain-containing protein n=1 Tax=Ophiobolus disseminans TaxID=1469910 RepID=A0A6A6ZH06_9PLEO|nr:hypothetical protein CC86DRAFT_471378 [Ophiobolus disseminans]